MITNTAATSGYVTDVGYSATFTPVLAPDWLDMTALIAGFVPPARRGEFAYCELACGRGLNAAVLAATHPGATFHAVDFMKEHIAWAGRLAERAGIKNLTLHPADFAGAAQMELPRFQYIVAHGAYSWIDAQARADLRNFIDRHLAPGGLVCLSYNAMPGWLADLPLQRLIAAFADGVPGDSIAKFAAAEAALRRLSAAGVPALTASPMFARFPAEGKDQLPASYFAHEYLAPAWQPLYVTDARAELATIGLRPVGSAILANNFDSYVLRAAQREILRRRFALVRPEPLVTLSMRTKAGTLRFDNPLTRAIVAALEQGPLPLRKLEGPASDIVANALALAAAGVIRPVNGSDVPVDALNEALAEFDNEAEPLPYRALPCGTALRLEPALHDYLRGRGRLPRRLRAWPDFLARRT